MATSRSNATVGQDALLKQGFIHPATMVPMDPFKVRLVQILDTDGLTVLLTFDDIVGGANPDIANPGVGTYQGTATAAILDVAGTYYDKWFYTIDPGDAESSHTNSFVVSNPAAEPKLTDPNTSNMRVDVADHSVTPNIALKDLEVLAYETVSEKRVSTRTTDAVGKAFFVLKDNVKYTFAVRDPVNVARIFDQNNVDHTVLKKALSDLADPTIIAINAASVTLASVVGGSRLSLVSSVDEGTSFRRVGGDVRLSIFCSRTSGHGLHARQR